MIFNSLEFLIFLPIVFLVYWLLPKKIRYIWLLIASYVFYAFWDWKLLGLILCTTVVSFLMAIFISKSQKKGIKILCLVIGIVVTLGILVFFKYANFLISSTIHIINLFPNSNVKDYSLNLILPVGISFYTFQTLSYVIDVYKGKITPEKNFFYYSLYVSFFPQLVAGPIERPENLLPQLKQETKINIDNIQIGLKFILTGYIKKIVIADMLAVFINPIFNNLADMNGLLVVIGTCLFAVQILCDFAGYSDIAIGVAKLFNIDLMQNFNKPYRATSIRDFWSRWHISLSTWFRDYIYFPLGGSRVNKFRWALNILVVFLISGLWHGASWTFVIWGLMHAIFQIIGRLTLNIRNKFWTLLKVDVNGKLLYVLRMIMTFTLVAFSWIAFRANTIEDMLLAYKLLFTGWNFSSSYFATVGSVIDFGWKTCLIIVSALAILNVVDYIKVNYDPNKTVWFVVRKVIYLVGVWCVVFCFIYLNASGNSSSFIYFQF